MEATEVVPEAEIAALPTLEETYKATFPAVAKFISKMGGSFADAKDIYQDAFIIFLEKRSAGILPENDSAEAYILGIGKHLWYRKFRKMNRIVSTEDLQLEPELAIPPDYFDESNNRLLALLTLTGRKCLDLLNALYYENMSLPVVSEMFGFKNSHSASAQKFKCLEKIRNTVKAKSLRYEDFSN